MLRRSNGNRSAVWVASISSSVISPVSSAYAPAAHSKSAIAPLARSWALAGVSSPLAGMTLGLWTSRALLKRSHPVAVSRPRTRIVAYLIGRSPQVAHVDGDDPLRELRQVGAEGLPLP